MVQDNITGAYYFEVIIRQEREEFQVVLDGNWTQVLHPSSEDADKAPGTMVVGPDDQGHGLNWRLEGEPGDLFGVELRLDPSASGSSWRMSAAWLGPSLNGHDGVQAASWERAVQRLQEAKRWGHVDSVDFSVAIRACRDEGAFEAALKLLDDMWARDKQCSEPTPNDYLAVAEACDAAGEVERAAAVRLELERWGTPPPREELFQLSPVVHWNRAVRGIGGLVRNTLDWNGYGEVPMAPPRPCWLLPASDQSAVAIAEQQDELRDAGWLIFTCDPHVVERLDNKVSFVEFAQELGMVEYMPQRFANAEEAAYPCILKPATGEFGKGVHIAYRPEDVERIAGADFDSDEWLLQELCTGRFEYSTSMLVDQGQIIDIACTRYEYDAEVYVWPHVHEVGKSLEGVPPDHESIMRPFLENYTGFCNFNYKIRPDGRLCFFEVNARVGADLACDVPRAKALDMFKALAARAPQP